MNCFFHFCANIIRYNLFNGNSSAFYQLRKMVVDCLHCQPAFARNLFWLQSLGKKFRGVFHRPARFEFGFGAPQLCRAQRLRQVQRDAFFLFDGIFTARRQAQNRVLAADDLDMPHLDQLPDQRLDVALFHRLQPAIIHIFVVLKFENILRLRAM